MHDAEFTFSCSPTNGGRTSGLRRSDRGRADFALPALDRSLSCSAPFTRTRCSVSDYAVCATTSSSSNLNSLSTQDHSYWVGGTFGRNDTFRIGYCYVRRRECAVIQGTQEVLKPFHYGKRSHKSKPFPSETEKLRSLARALYAAFQLQEYTVPYRQLQNSVGNRWQPIGWGEDGKVYI